MGQTNYRAFVMNSTQFINAKQFHTLFCNLLFLIVLFGYVETLTQEADDILQFPNVLPIKCKLSSLTTCVICLEHVVFRTS